MLDYNHNDSAYLGQLLNLNMGWPYMVGQERLYVHTILASGGSPITEHLPV